MEFQFSVGAQAYKDIRRTLNGELNFQMTCYQNPEKRTKAMKLSWLEHSIHNAGVGGSSPPIATKYKFGSIQLGPSYLLKAQYFWAFLYTVTPYYSSKLYLNLEQMGRYFWAYFAKQVTRPPRVV